MMTTLIKLVGIKSQVDVLSDNTINTSSKSVASFDNQVSMNIEENRTNLTLKPRISFVMI